MKTLLEKHVLSVLLILILNVSFVCFAYAADGSAGGLLTADRYDNLQLEKKLDLMIIKENRDLLNNKAVMDYFILMNECNSGTSNAIMSFNNEFDYPKYVQFYKEHYGEICNVVKNKITIELGPVELGKYNQQSNSFSFVFSEGISEHVLKEINLTQTSTRAVFCKGFSTSQTPMFIGYSVTVPEMKFKDFPMDEASARAYVEGNGAKMRLVKFIVEIVLLKTPTLSFSEFTKPSGKLANFSGKIVKVTAVNANGKADLNVVLYSE